MFSESNKIAEQKKQFTKKYMSLLLSCILIELYRINTNDSEILEEKIPPSLHIQKAIYFIRSHFKENITQKYDEIFNVYWIIAISEEGSHYSLFWVGFPLFPDYHHYNSYQMFVYLLKSYLHWAYYTANGWFRYGFGYFYS